MVEFEEYGNNFHVHATNDVTSTLIARKCTLAGALGIAHDLLDDWSDVHIREYVKEGDEPFKVIAHLSKHGII